MTEIFTMQAILVFLAAFLATLAIIARQSAWQKGTALVLFSALIGLGYFSVIELLGKPKPVRFASIVTNDETATIIATRMVENEAIYLWLVRNTSAEPVAYVLPWNLETAKKIRREGQKAKARGTGLKLSRRKGNNNVTGEWVFHAAPINPLPPKTGKANG